MRVEYELPTQDGRTPLIRAAWRGRTDCIRLRLESGADKDAKDNVRGTKYIDVLPDSVLLI